MGALRSYGLPAGAGGAARGAAGSRGPSRLSALAAFDSAVAAGGDVATDSDDVSTLPTSTGVDDPSDDGGGTEI
jgi:hypothetical protein